MLYQILWLPPTASQDQIKSNYKQMAMAVHPDRNQQQLEKASVAFREIEHAHAILSNPVTRIVYDEYGDAGLKLYGYFKGQFEELRGSEELKKKVLCRYKAVKIMDENTKAIEKLEKQKIKIRGSMLYYFLLNAKSWNGGLPFMRIAGIDYSANLKHKYGSIGLSVEGKDGELYPKLTNTVSWSFIYMQKSINLSLENDLMNPANFYLEFAKWNLESMYLNFTNSSYKVGLTFSDMTPNITLRQIYSAEKIYAQTYQQIGLSGISGGALVSKSVNITDSTVYSTSVRTNFTDYNWANKLQVNLNSNIAVSLKMVR